MVQSLWLIFALLDQGTAGVGSWHSASNSLPLTHRVPLFYVPISFIILNHRNWWLHYCCDRHWWLLRSLTFLFFIIIICFLPHIARGMQGPVLPCMSYIFVAFLINPLWKLYRLCFCALVAQVNRC